MLLKSASVNEKDEVIRIIKKQRASDLATDKREAKPQPHYIALQTI